MRLVGLLTFFILALALGGGMGVPVGVSSPTTPPSLLTLGFGSGAPELPAAAASSSAGGAGGGGRCLGFARLCTVVVRRFGTTSSLLGFGAAASDGGGKGAAGSAVGTSSPLLLKADGPGVFDEVGVFGRCGEGGALPGAFSIGDGVPVTGGGGANRLWALAGADFLLSVTGFGFFSTGSSCCIKGEKGRLSSI